MTTSDEAIKRVYTLIKKCQELKQNGHDEITVRKLLKKYHGLRVPVPHCLEIWYFVIRIDPQYLAIYAS